MSLCRIGPWGLLEGVAPRDFSAYQVLISGAFFPLKR